VATVGQNLQKLRERAGFANQTALARAAGMSLSQVSDVEADRYHLPDTKTLLKLAKALRCSVEEILEEVDPAYSSMLRESGLLRETADEEALAHRLPEDDELAGVSSQTSVIPVVREGEVPPTDLRLGDEPESIPSFEGMSTEADRRDRGVYALVLGSDSMEPVLKRGMRLIASINESVTDGDLTYVQLKSGERFAQIAARHSCGWLLSSANPSYPPRFVADDQIESIHKVVYVRFLT